MIEDNHFQLTLISNARMDYCPTNKPADFTTKLVVPKRIEGDWEVALVELQYPHNWNTFLTDAFIGLVLEPPQGVTIDDFKANLGKSLETLSKEGHEIYDKIIGDPLVIKNEAAGLMFRIPKGYYDSITDIIEIMNNEMRECLASSNGTIELNLAPKNLFSKTVFTKKGIKSITPYSNNDKILKLLTYATDLHYGPELRFQLDPIRTIFVYCDIIDYQLVGDTQAPLLGTAPVTGMDGDQPTHTFNPIFYIPVQNKLLDKVKLYLCDEFGDPVPFENTGRVICRLQFRRRHPLL